MRDKRPPLVSVEDPLVSVGITNQDWGVPTETKGSCFSFFLFSI
jgi:hypothetical protein